MSRTHHPTISTDAESRLDALVDRIEAQPGTFIDLDEMRAAQDAIDVRNVLAHLPPDLSEEDFVGILKLAMLTEAATDSYAAVFEEGARLHKASWLSRFTQRVWVPDEHTHAMPYKLMLLDLGHEEAELDREIGLVQDERYEHCCGKTPVELTTYGVIQEYLTDHWHGLISRLMKPSAPLAAHMANQVKARETLHTLWYRDMTAVLVEEDPETLGLVADTVLGFKMPGNALVPQYQAKARHWMPHLGVDYDLVARELVRNFSHIAGTVRGTGELLIEIAVRRGYTIGPLPPRAAQVALDRMGGMGYGLLGEAILERVGLPLPAGRRASNGHESNARGMGVYHALHERARGMTRRYIGRRIDLRTVTGETS